MNHTHTHTHMNEPYYSYNNYNTYVRTYIHTYIHTYIRTYIHTYIHTYNPRKAHTCLGEKLIDQPYSDTVTPATTTTLSHSKIHFEITHHTTH